GISGLEDVLQDPCGTSAAGSDQCSNEILKSSDPQILKSRMDLNQIRQILDLVREHELSEFEIEHEGLRLKIRKDVNGAHVVTVPAPANPAGVTAPAPAGPAPDAANGDAAADCA